MKIKKMGTRKKVYLVSTYNIFGNVAASPLNITTPSKNLTDSFFILFFRIKRRKTKVVIAANTVKIGKVLK
jgi:hypothetical protein